MKIKKVGFFCATPIYLTTKTKYRNCESVLCSFKNKINKEKIDNIEQTLIEFLDIFGKESKIRAYLKQEKINKLEISYLEIRENQENKEIYSELIGVRDGLNDGLNYIMVLHKNKATFRYLIYPEHYFYKENSKICCNKQCTYKVYFEYFIGENHCPIIDKCKKRCKKNKN